MIPPSNSDPQIDGNGSATATQTAPEPGSLVPVHSGLPADIHPDWMDSGSLWGGSDAQHQGISPMEFLHSFRRRWILAVGLAVLAATVVAAVVYIAVPVYYEAVALLRVHPTPVTFLDNHRASQRANTAEIEAYRATQRELVVSDHVLSQALKSPRVQEASVVRQAKDKLKALKQEVRVGFLARSDLMAIQMKADSHREAEVVVNAVLDAYMDQVVRQERNVTVHKHSQALDYHKTKQDELRRARQNLQLRGEELGSTSLPSQRIIQKMDLDELAYIKRQMIEISRHADDTELKLLLLKQQLENVNRHVPPHKIEEALQGDPQWQMLMQQEAAQENMVRTQAQLSSRNHANLRRLQERLQQTQQQKLSYRQTVSQQIRKNQTQGSGREEQRQLESQLNVLRHRQNELAKHHDELAKRVRDRDAGTEDFEMQLDYVRQLEKQVQDVASQIHAWDLELKAPQRVVEVHRATHQPPNRIYKLMLTAGAAVIAFGLTLLSVTGIEFLAQRVSTVQDVSKRLGVGLVGTLPPMTRGGMSQLFNRMDEDQFETILGDSVDGIRTALIHGASGNGHHVVMVTSASDGEGKTTVASQLAVSLARCGRRTLLIDADLRNPTLHELFGLPHERGLGEVLRNEIDADDAIRPTPAEGLHLLGAGHGDHTAIQALENDAVGRLFNRLRGEFDFVIIDTPPVLAFADSLLIGQYVDGAILSVRLDVSQRPKMEESVTRMRGVGIQLLGAVVNGAKPPTSRRGYVRMLAAN